VSLLQGHAGEYRRGDQPGVSQTNRRVASIGRTLTQPYER
jgi:hypothetical protein